MKIVYNKQATLDRKNEYDKKYKEEFEKRKNEDKRGANIFTIICIILLILAVVSFVAYLYCFFEQNDLSIIFILAFFALLAIAYFCTWIIKEFYEDEIQCQINYPFDVQFMLKSQDHNLLSINKKEDEKKEFAKCILNFEDKNTGNVSLMEKTVNIISSTKYTEDVLVLAEEVLYIPEPNHQSNFTIIENAE